MLKRLWQWLKRFIQRLFRSKRTVSPPLREQKTVEIIKQLTDIEYESLFLQLLAEVNDGLGRGGVKGFLAAKRINEGNLVEWLRGFGERLLASTAANDELAARLVRFGELGVGELGDVARDIGKQLTNRRGADSEEGGELELQVLPEVAKLFTLLQNNNNVVHPFIQNLGITTIPEVKTNFPALTYQINNIAQEIENIPTTWFDLGVKQTMIGDFEGAISSYDKALEIKPGYYEAWYLRGYALSNLKRNEEAIASFDKVLAIQPDYYAAWNRKGAALDHLKRYEDAIASFDQAIKIDPDNHEAWHNKGNMLDKLGEYEKALISYDKAQQLDSSCYSGWNARGVTLTSLGRDEEAILSCDKALAIQPNDHLAWFNRGNALVNLGRYEEALTSSNKALEIEPNFHQAWDNRGTALRNLGCYEEAILSYDKALEIQPDYHQVWDNRGIALGNLGRYEEAILSSSKALEIQPDFHYAWNNRGFALGNLGCHEEAILSYDKAIEIQPNFHLAWNNRGNTLLNLGRYEEAILSCDKALEIQPDFHPALYNRGIALLNLGRYEEAILSYDKALAIQPDIQQAWNNRGIAARNSINFNQLLAFSSSIARQNPQLNQRGYEGELASYEEGLKYCHQDTHPQGWGELHQAIGKAYYFRGRADSHPRSYWHKAVTSYNEALKTLTEVDFPELHLEVLQNLIRVHSDLGETAKAEELKRWGTDLLLCLLNEPNRPDKSKKQLAFKFAWLQQLTVDLAVQSGNLLQAVELAEQGKNACLSWLLDGWSDEISSPSYSQMQQLLNPTTAIVYWHLSPYALHTFILKHDTPEPIALGETGVLNQPQRLRDFEDWLKKWNEQYADYRQGKKGEVAGTWRDNLPEMLHSLSNILDINTIVSHIPDITQLILIPHRDLHRLPLHELFPPEFTISYLPSVQIGLISSSFKPQGNKLDKLLSIEHPTSSGYPSLEFAQIESQAISRMFPNPTRQRSEEATKAAVINALRQGYNIFHFTGHGIYNFHNPALSHLALAGEDKLTLVDIRNFDLSSYQLVSLAACETAITGNHTITNEYVGLVSGFMSCGVAHVVSTLWTVESEASALMMMQFYNLLQQGKSEAVALAGATQWLRNVNNAQLAAWYAGEIDKLPADEDLVRRFLSRHLDNLKNQSEPSKQPYNHPYFWSAFTITGIFPM
ncbi:CHAT domain-containing protein [Calothrix sp. PCC 7507]|uniref:CHAT domain-containing protein n=1 Tax=Calothrix sp. PCC 7507 TaxID=99598 RepID=UPI00029F0819|nr:tetratricopeptide repeat protein [Calothrix sp. PCC 7507]AFY31115.1 Tetratricopeptide TPR_1 repeat-containing protein [Calothrix sp. PCC 7507]